MYIPKKHELFTASPNKNCGDRSYCSEVIECLSVNDGHVFARFYGPAVSGWCKERDPFILVIDEHDFYYVSEFTLRRFMQEIA